jgi:hypothetical protein
VSKASNLVHLPSLDGGENNEYLQKSLEGPGSADISFIATFLVAVHPRRKEMILIVNGDESRCVTPRMSRALQRVGSMPLLGALL